MASTGILPSLQLNKDPERAKPSGFYIRFSLSGINPGINVILIFSSSSASPAVNETAPADFSESWGRLSQAVLFSHFSTFKKQSVLCDSSKPILNMGNIFKEEL